MYLQVNQIGHGDLDWYEDKHCNSHVTKVVTQCITEDSTHPFIEEYPTEVVKSNKLHRPHT